MDEMKIAVLIPCRNEETTIDSVINGFRENLPDADTVSYTHLRAHET